MSPPKPEDLSEDDVKEITSLLHSWKMEQYRIGFDPISVISRIAEIIEIQTEKYMKLDPDPFDDRHPGRIDPNCTLGHIMKVLMKEEDFLTKLLDSYLLARDNFDLNVASSRLLLDIIPAVDAVRIFQESEGVIEELFRWAESARDPLCYYACGLLAAASEAPDASSVYREHNTRLFPVLLRRLRDLRDCASHHDHQVSSNRTPAAPGRSFEGLKDERFDDTTARPLLREVLHATTNDHDRHSSGRATTMNESRPNGIRVKRGNVDDGSGPAVKRLRADGALSNSSWADIEPYVIGRHRVYPLDDVARQRLLLAYLASVGEYQEFLPFVFDFNSTELIYYYIDLEKNKDVRLALDALKFLASLLCHKKFALEFVGLSGVEHVLGVLNESMASAGVALCLYYLAYNEDVMEKICLLPASVLDDLVQYALWLLEHSYESGRCHAIMFFTHAFPFRSILDRFDERDGLRKLINCVATLNILQAEESASFNLTDDQVYTSRQAVRHVCFALKKYFESHVWIKMENLKRTQARSILQLHTSSEINVGLSVSRTKAMTFDYENLQNCVGVLLDCVLSSWKPVDEFCKLGGVVLLLQIIGRSPEWNYASKAEMICNALIVLLVCSVMQRVQLMLCENVTFPENHAVPAASILLGLSDGELIDDPEVQKATLNVLINCVCGPTRKFVGSSYRSASTSKQHCNVLQRMWDCVRTNNGIMVLRNLLFIKTPITEADAIRALACKALDGLARSDIVKQILSKMLLISNSQLHTLMREPVLPDKRSEHRKFVEYARSLIERVTDRPITDFKDLSHERLEKASIVAHTSVSYNEKELLQLIYQHFCSKGLRKSANILQQEADLLSQPGSGTVAISKESGVLKSLMTARALTLPRSISTSGIKASPNPIRFLLPGPSPARSAQRPPLPLRTAPAPSEHLSLDAIVKQFCRNQHALCRQPVVTCPPFSLLHSHQCPEPKLLHSAPTNFCKRFYQRSIHPTSGGYDGHRCDLTYIFSRFKPIRVYKDEENEETFTCCSFSIDDQFLLLGTYAGDVKWYNIATGSEESSLLCHTSALTAIEQSKDGALLLTSSAFVKPYSALWSIGDNLEPKCHFMDDYYVEFSKTSQDRIVGTKGDEAVVYDAGTGQALVTLFDPALANHYARNRATFHPQDDLVLSDGILWDARGGRAVHKFDKLNPNRSGLFHPRGLELIINTEVWDIRTFRLLHTVPALDQCKVVFNSTGDIIFGAVHQGGEDDFEESKIRTSLGCSFRTFDAANYSLIATIDIKKNILDLCMNRSDSYLAVIENQGKVDDLLSLEENVCRLYEVGKQREGDEEFDEVQEEELDDEDGGDSDLDELDVDEELLTADAERTDGGNAVDNETTDNGAEGRLELDSAASTFSSSEYSESDDEEFDPDHSFSSDSAAGSDHLHYLR